MVHYHPHRRKDGMLFIKRKKERIKSKEKKKSFIFIPDKIMPSPENEVLVHSCRAPEE